MGVRKDSIWGMWTSLGSVKAMSFVLSGTKIVLELTAYCSLNIARNFREIKSLDNRAVSSAWPMADVIRGGRLE